MPFATRLYRPLVALFRPVVVWCWIERRTAGSDDAIPASTAAATATATSERHRHATAATPITTTSSAAKLDCENEISSPSHVTTIAATVAADSSRARPSTSRTMLGTIATTRNRPYTEGSQNTELTRKNGAYALP